MSLILLSLLLLCSVYSARTQTYDYVYGLACQNTTNCPAVSYTDDYNETLTIPTYCMHTGPTGDGVCCIAPSGFGGGSGMCSANSQCCSGYCSPSGPWHICTCLGGGSVCDNNGLCCSGTCTNYACTCTPAAQSCQADNECCSGFCQPAGPYGGTCACLTQADCVGNSLYCFHANPAVPYGTCLVTQGGGELGTYNYCSHNYICTSGYCLPGKYPHKCACTGGGNICDNNVLCCSGTCTNNVCACSPTSSPCQQNSECCSENCQSGACE